MNRSKLRQYHCLSALPLATAYATARHEGQQKAAAKATATSRIRYSCIKGTEKGRVARFPAFCASPLNLFRYSLSPSGSTMVISNVHPRADTSLLYSDSLKSFRVNLLDKFFCVCPERRASAVCVVLSFFIAVFNFWRKSIVSIMYLANNITTK